MDTEKFYRASDIFSHNATATRPAKRGILPIKRTAFYALLKAGKFPPPDTELEISTDKNKVRLWRASTIERFLSGGADAAAPSNTMTE